MRLRRLMIASAFVAAFVRFLGPASAQDGPRQNINGPAIISTTSPSGAISRHCLELCRTTRGCRAWTFVKPGFQGASARCWLKDVVPAAVSNPCCTSGVVRIMN